MRNLYRRFTSWLARVEIQKAYERGYGKASATAAVAVRMEVEIAYARGQCEGRQQMYDHINEIVGRRTCGAEDVVTPADMALAKKGLLH